ncbi:MULTISPECIES: methyl-accepting chemotaxis protein [unclassified Pseudomonas]|uniref:methyl-accepting chemotaxis protein n=1 Tax=unclassified Pseudomonas TaxID=196821 RepID=UPI000BC55E05|nr:MULTISPECIES: methyl-accepting chemotaxis protein [unclassified Pseudomonas]PVZ15919.1 methyl-accepting chemotaxis protein [Pseudomonas sp. URIL14HWK12:I12]PVZ26225.1 methyl-accepting chemotaxis protein [Pseudomonas sp. URIL14HWK12:I10]PVZ36251.1 methyl-accepting chemotaxis protein [Pseudomonas sp. URIL14HWK12:I11]SNZ18245.1 Methyl-accepting chemotaxis protein [Pseudomonas sp. URIL14HWK12:I9]
MNAFLAPGIGLLGRFRFARKFQLLFLLFMMPLAASLWMVASDYKQRLGAIGKERTGVLQLLALEQVDDLLVMQRDRAARWKAVDILREPTPAAREAMAALQGGTAPLAQAIKQLGEALEASGASTGALKRYQALQQATQGLDVEGIRTSGWWPDGYEKFTSAIGTVQLLREQLAMDSGLILDPWMETYLLMQISTTQAPGAVERVGRLASVGEASVVAGQFSLQSRLQMRDLRSRIGDAREQLVKSGDMLKARLPDGLEAWTAQYQSSIERLDQELKRLDDGLFGGSVTMAAADFEKNIDGLLAELSALRKQSLLSLDNRLAFYHGQAVMQFLPVAGSFAVLLLAALYLFVCLQASIRNSARGITTLAESLRDGNLCVQVQVTGKDELAVISTALNSAVVQLRGSLGGVDRETVALGGTVQALNSQAGATLIEVEQQQQQISQIATAATQLAATSQGVAQSCELASSTAQQTRQIAMASSRDSQRTTDSIQQLNQRLADTAQALSRVSEQGQQIQSVVDVIGGIAGQTNLLALNAAIEAARAGEQGRGFAVVADEVRSLSQRTQASTAQIASTVDSLRGTVRQAVELMEVACAQALQDAQAVTGLGESLGKIAGAVQDVTDNLTLIATAVEQQAATADEVSGNIQQIDQAAMRLLDGARAVNGAADQLSAGSRSLSQNTARFQLA